MKFMLSLDVPALENKITHKAPIFFIGSCFSANVSSYLKNAKYSILSNPTGPLYNPKSILQCISAAVQKKVYESSDLDQRADLFLSFDVHSDFSDTDQDKCLEKINNSIQETHDFLRKAEYIVITVGTAFVYKHIEYDRYVSNNHKFPSQTFRRELMRVDEVCHDLFLLKDLIRTINRDAKFIYTVSPIRYIGHGLIDNNRSKGILFDAIHSIIENNGGYYFPAFELVTDVLRDYGFYKKDMIHPNTQAIEFVWKFFEQACLHDGDQILRDRLMKLHTSLQHKSLHPGSVGAISFKKSVIDEMDKIIQDYPYLTFDEEKRSLSF